MLHYEQRAARRRSHRKKGERTSRRLSKTYDRIARIRATAKRRREDWQHKTTTAIASTYGTVVVEALHITNMTSSAKGTVEQPGRQVAQKAGLNRSILGETWGRTVHLLAYKLARRGGLLAEVPAPGTSQECAQCHTVIPGSRRNQAEFVQQRRVRLGRQRRHQRRRHGASPIPDGPRARPGCRKGSRQARSDAPATSSRAPDRTMARGSAHSGVPPRRADGPGPCSVPSCPKDAGGMTR
ncbi:transposase [Streptomyces sp. NPDC002845]